MTRTAFSKIRTFRPMGAAWVAATLLTGTMAAAGSPPLPSVPARFVDHGPGTTLSINFNTYCSRKHDGGRQHLGPSKWWNAWACWVPAPGGGSLVGIDLYDVCRKLYPGSTPVNNTGSAYNWYCKR